MSSEYKDKDQVDARSPYEIAPILTPEQAHKIVRVIYNGETLSYSEAMACRGEFELPDRSPNIEFAGTPNSFKTTGLHSLVTILSRAGVQTKYVEESSPDLNKGDYPIEYTFTFLYQTMLSVLNKSRKEVALIDRGVFDRIAFLSAYKDLGTIGHRSIERHKAHLLDLWGKHVDALVIQTARVDTSMDREHSTTDPKNIMNDDFLSQLAFAHKSLEANVAITSRRIGVLTNKPIFLLNLDTTYMNEGPEAKHFSLLQPEYMDLHNPHLPLLIQNNEDYDVLAAGFVGSVIDIFDRSRE